MQTSANLTIQHEAQDTRLPLQRPFRPQLTKYSFSNGAAMAVQEYLPGNPKKRLVKLVRMILRRYGIKPRGQQWRATWHWAHAICISYYHPHWPTALEISTQYVLRLIAEIKQSDGLKLPHRASTVIPDEVRALLPGNPVPLLIHEPVIANKDSE